MPTWHAPHRGLCADRRLRDRGAGSRDGSIDWLCWPRFDSDACFAALLGTPENGRWLIAPHDGEARVSRRYREDTLILETRFETDEGAVDADRLHAAAQRQPRTSCASWSASAAASRCARSWCCASATARSCRGSRGSRRHAARRRRPGHGAAAHAGRTPRRELQDRRRVHRQQPARRVPVRADLLAVASAAAGAVDPHDGARRDRGVLARLVARNASTTGHWPRRGRRAR